MSLEGYPMQRKIVSPLMLTVIFIMLFLPALSSAAELKCARCHGKLAKGKIVHKAMDMGCATCHGGIDKSAMPHKKTNALPKGLTSEQPGLCYGCHDKGLFTKKNVHAAVGLGCTGCHDPHSSRNGKLLVSEIPALCFTCHDKSGFSDKNIHPPVMSGDCVTCHSPHSSDMIALLVKKPVEVCLQCHADSAEHGKHAPIVGDKEPEDPKKPGRPFYCGSCHNPHSSNTPLLFRFDAQTTSGLCINCHAF
jgi:predicted CXXCH cytochrome family protein